MSSNKELILYEEELKDYCKKLNSVTNEMEEIINDYISVLVNLNVSGIKSGDVAKSLSAYIGHIKFLKGKFKVISMQTEKHTRQYLDQVDDDDSYVY